MRFVHIENLRSGEQLARPIFAPDGRILLNSGVQMETTYIERLRGLGSRACTSSTKTVPV